MFTEEEIKEAEKQAQKSEVVKKLLDFYNDCQQDGVKAFGISLNKKLIVLSQQIDSADINIAKIDDKVFDRIFKAMVDGGKIAENLRIINSKETIENIPTKKSKAHEGKVVT